MIHRYHPRLGLQVTPSSPFNAKICRESSQTIPTCQENKTATCTISKRSDPIWSQEAICHTSFHSSTARCKRKEVCPVNMRQIPIPLTSGRQYTSLSHQRHCLAIRKSANPTEDTLRQINQLLNYIATQEDAVLTYNVSNMKLVSHSNASYLSKPKSRSRSGGRFFL